MALSTRDFMVHNDNNIMKPSDGSLWIEDPNPTNPFSDVKPIYERRSGKTWGEREEDFDKEREKKYRSRSGDRYFSKEHSEKDKENKRERKYVEKELETDKRKLQTRQRQIDIGKETSGYKRYIKEVKRRDRTIDHPKTPNKYTVCSTRSWQGTVRVWRRKLHYWDGSEEQKNAQKKFANILTSPYMFYDEQTNDEEERPQMRRINNSIDNEDCISEGSSQNSSEGDVRSLNGEPSDNVLFWTGI